MASPEGSDKFEQEVNQSLGSIVDDAERSATTLKRRERNSRIARSIILGFLECAIVIVVILGIVELTSGTAAFTKTLGFLFATFGAGSWLIGSALTYVILARRKNPRLQELSNLIQQIRTKKVETTTENALSLADRIVAILPEIVRKRTEDSLVYGILAFIVSLIITHFAPVAVIVGVVVWLFFRYEMNRSYEKEIAKFEEQKRLFEQRKKDFIESL